MCHYTSRVSWGGVVYTGHCRLHRLRLIVCKVKLMVKYEGAEIELHALTLAINGDEWPAARPEGISI